MLRRLGSAQVAIFLGVWLLLLLVGRSSLLRDPGTPWHVVVGRQILQSGHVPQTDRFSFTQAGQPWTAHQWLAEVAMALIHRVAGWDGLLLATAAVLAAVYAAIGGRLLRSGLHWMTVLLVLALVLVSSTHNYHVRPLVVSVLLQTWTVGLLIDVESGRAGFRRLIWLLPAFILWTNLHGGVLGGIGTVGLAALGWIAFWAVGRPSPVKNRADLLALTALVAACCLTVLVNPYGLGLPRAWLVTMVLPLPDLILEHAPLDPTTVFGIAAVTLAILYAIVLLASRGRPTRATWLLPLVWFVLACQRIRNLPLFAATAAVVLADLLPHSRAARWLAARELFHPPAEKDAACSGFPWAAVLPSLAVAVVFVVQIAGLRVPVVGRGWARFDPAHWPVGLLDELRRINDASPDGTPIFNDLDFGGFLIYHAPRLRVFLDDRCALHGAMLEAYDRAWRDEPAELDRWYAQYGFPYALVRTGGAFDGHLSDSPDWTPVAVTPVATLYRHHTPPRPASELPAEPRTPSRGHPPASPPTGTPPAVVE